MDAQLSRKIANLGWICACLVVTIHMDHPLSGSALWLDRLLDGAISTAAVPLFFCISGYLLAGKVDGDGWWSREVGKRVGSLLLPFYLWGLIGVLASLPFDLLVDVREGTWLGSHFLCGRDWLDVLIKWSGVNFCAMPLLGPLWFLRGLFVLVVLSPGLVWGVRRWGMGWVVVLLAVFVAWRALGRPLGAAANGFFWYGLSLSGLWSFSLGLYLRLRGGWKLGAGHKAVVLLLALAGILWVQLSPAYGAWRTPLMIPVYMLAIWICVPDAKWPAAWVRTAFPIYLMHMIVICWLTSAPSLGLNTSTWFGYVTIWWVSIFASMLVSVGLRKFWPSGARVLLGGR